MNPNKALWEKGDFTRIARHMRASGEALVATLGIVPGMQLLDLGCGDGTTAIPAAKLGADVTGIDIASNLVAAAKAHAAAEGVENIAFHEGDASDLHNVADASFDLVVSVFGAMFAPRPYDVAKEMLRVTKPGGRIVMGNWIPEDPTLVAQILKTSAAFSPPPPEGFISPMLWGREDEVTARFVAAGASADGIAFERDVFRMVFPGSPRAFLQEFIAYYGPTMNAVAAAEADGRGADLREALGALFETQNRAGSPERTEMLATFLKVTVTKQ